MNGMERDKVVARLCMLCIMAGLSPLAWFEMSAKEFEVAVRRKVCS